MVIFFFFLFLLLLNLIILPPPLHFFLYSSLHLHYDPIGPFIDPTSTLHSFFFFFNTASWIVKLYTTPILLLFSLHHNHISIVLTPPTPPTHFYCFLVFPSPPPPPPHLYNIAYFCPPIFKGNVVTLGHQSTEEGGETFSDTTHGCSFSVMLIICFMVKNGSSVLMVHGVLYYQNALVSLQL